MSEIAPERLATNRTSRPTLKTRPGRGSDNAGAETALVTDADLARARLDAAFHHQLVAGSLEMLLRELNKLRGSANNATTARQIREGVELAVRLADLLQRIVAQGSGHSDPGTTRAA
jgi:hypothetical protein